MFIYWSRHFGTQPIRVCYKLEFSEGLICLATVCLYIVNKAELKAYADTHIHLLKSHQYTHSSTQVPSTQVLFILGECSTFPNLMEKSLPAARAPSDNHSSPLMVLIHPLI